MRHIFGVLSLTALAQAATTFTPPIDPTLPAALYSYNISVTNSLGGEASYHDAGPSPVVKTDLQRTTDGTSIAYERYSAFTSNTTPSYVGIQPSPSLHSGIELSLTGGAQTSVSSTFDITSEITYYVNIKPLTNALPFIPLNTGLFTVTGALSAGANGSLGSSSFGHTSIATWTADAIIGIKGSTNAIAMASSATVPFSRSIVNNTVPFIGLGSLGPIPIMLKTQVKGTFESAAKESPNWIFASVYAVVDPVVELTPEAAQHFQLEYGPGLFDGTVTPPTSEIPEPATWELSALALVLLGFGGAARIPCRHFPRIKENGS
jgi:hypothetical protein